MELRIYCEIWGKNSLQIQARVHVNHDRLTALLSYCPVFVCFVLLSQKISLGVQWSEHASHGWGWAGWRTKVELVFNMFLIAASSQKHKPINLKYCVCYFAVTKVLNSNSISLDLKQVYEGLSPSGNSRKEAVFLLFQLLKSTAFLGG